MSIFCVYFFQRFISFSFSLVDVYRNTCLQFNYIKQQRIVIKFKYRVKIQKKALTWV